MYKTIILISLIANFEVNFKVKADECPPHDPNGVNPNTLCIKHYLPRINNIYHQTGNGINAFHGSSNDIRYPGKKVIDSPLDSDYFTNVSTGDKSNGIIIKTKNGKTFEFPSE